MAKGRYTKSTAKTGVQHKRLVNGLYEITIKHPMVVTEQQLGEVTAMLSEPAKDDPYWSAWRNVHTRSSRASR